jgi:MFS superfamily sulfate permease-like transporter
VPLGDSEFVAMTAGLAIATGLAALIAGLLRLGFLATFISEPVIKGFIVGLALTIRPCCWGSRQSRCWT